MRATPTVVATLLVMLLTVAGAVTAAWAVFGRPATEASASAARVPIDGYPQRIGFERPSSPLPDRPGPLAATLVDNNYGNARDLGVTSRGRVWELPRGINALSPDGEVLVTGEPWGDYSSRLAVHDLTSGERRVLDDVGWTYDSSEAQRFRYLVDEASALHWSQDASLVLARVSQGRDRKSRRPMVLDIATGGLTPVVGGHPAGFRSPTEVVTVSKVGGGSAPGGILATISDLETGAAREVQLQLGEPWRGDSHSDLQASVSPDGVTLLLVENTYGSNPSRDLRLFSLSDGEEVERRGVPGMADFCSLTWFGDDPVIPTRSGTAGSAVMTADGFQPLVAVHHRMQSTCLELTPAALEAGPHGAIWGTRTDTWTWYWQPALAFVLAMGGSAWLAWRYHRR